MTVRPTSKEILDAQIRAWDDLIPELERDAFMTKALDSQRAWVGQVAFSELMIAPDCVLTCKHYVPGKLAL